MASTDGFTPWPDELAHRYREAGYWRGDRLGDITREWARRDPGRTAVVGRERSSYGEIDAAADRLAAGWWSLGLRRGDAVVVQLPNVVEFVTVSLALFRIGARPVYALPQHRAVEIGHLATVTGARGYVIPDVLAGFDHRELAAEIQARCPALEFVVVAGEGGPHRTVAALEALGAGAPPLPADAGPAGGDIAFFLLSGGTTGMPKLIPRTHDDYAFQLRATAAAMAVDADSVYLAALPAAHNAALGCPGVLGALAVGAKVVLAGSPSPDETFGLITAEGVTMTTLMPPLLAVWTDLAPVLDTDLTPVLLQVGGADLQPATARRVTDAGYRLTHWFGMAEGVLCFTRLDDPPEVVATTQGRPLAEDDELLVVDEDDRPVPDGTVGELLARGPCTLRGYYRAGSANDASFTADGYLRTGDLACFDGDGRLRVKGRIKDVVNRGGEKVPSAELEEHIEAHPGVRACAVVPVPDAGLGEKVCAFVVPEGEGVHIEELRRFLTDRGLAVFKLPDRVETVAELPRTTVGKTDKRALRELAGRAI